MPIEKRKFKSKAQMYGWYFGKVCKYIGSIGFLMFLFAIPNEKILINKSAVIPCLIFGVITLYGIFRTGGIKYEK